MKKTEQAICQNKKDFIKEYPYHGSVGATLEAIGIKSRKTFYNWRDSDPKFAAVYYDELIPNSRDAAKGVVYRMATTQKNVALCPVCEGAGKVEGRNCHGCRGRGWVEVHADSTQLTAAFGFLKATDHIEKPDAKDRTIFIEKHQITGEDGGPIKAEVNIKVVSESAKTLTEAILTGQRTEVKPSGT